MSQTSHVVIFRNYDFPLYQKLENENIIKSAELRAERLQNLKGWMGKLSYGYFSFNKCSIISTYVVSFYS